MFVNLKEAWVLAEDYRGHDSQIGPHGALGYSTLAEVAAVEAHSVQSPSLNGPKSISSVPRSHYASSSVRTASRIQ